MHHGQVKELPGRFTDLQIPIAIHCRLGRRERDAVAGKRLGGVAEHVSGKLICQNDIRQRAAGICQPKRKAPLASTFPGGLEFVGNIRVQSILCRVPPFLTHVV